MGSQKMVGKPKKRAMQVNVVVRVRPILPHERLQPIALQCIKAGHGQSKHTEISITSSTNGDNNTTRFAFEKCYDDTTPQRLLFQREIQPAIAKVLQGINTTIFAYGATGTGKTFTMEGSKRNLGMIPRAVKRLFEVAAEQKRVCQLELSYLEIYNDKILDLLIPASQQTDLPIRQQSDGTIAVQGLTRKRMSTLDTFEALYEQGSRNRKCAGTGLNAASSRSHSILMIHTLTTEGRDAKCGKLNLIDLAGSEDNRRTGNQGTRLIESGKINMSLFVLGKVIMALNQGDVQRIPYRDSKLTRMLQDSLGGSNHAVMICTVAPTEAMANESLQTLNYASKAKGIVNQVIVQSTKPTINRLPSREREKGTVREKKMTVKTATIPSSRGLSSRKSLMPISGSKTHRPIQEATRSLSISPPKCEGLMEQKLTMWKQTHRGTSPTTSSIGIKRPALTTTSLSTKRPALRTITTSSNIGIKQTTALKTATSSIGIKRPATTTLGLPTPQSSLGRSITTQALRVPVQKKSRVLSKPVSPPCVGRTPSTTLPLMKTTRPNVSEHKENIPINTSLSVSSKVIALTEEMERSPVKSTTAKVVDLSNDKENIPSNTMSTTNASATMYVVIRY